MAGLPRTAGIARMSVHGVDLEVVRRGTGRPILLLHGFEPVAPGARFLDLLSAHSEVVAPSHPGFGSSERPEGFDTVYDLVHLYLDAIDTLAAGTGQPVALVGLSFGGWLAAEIAATCSHGLARLALVDAVGIKLGGRETRDILDVFNASPAEVARGRWHDPARRVLDFDAMTDEAIVAHARNRDALCLYGWHPCLYNPRLPRWLPRIAVPTLVLWGARDGIVSPAYGQAYGALIPGARFALIESAGHHPEIEQPEAVVAELAAVLND